MMQPELLLLPAARRVSMPLTASALTMHGHGLGTAQLLKEIQWCVSSILKREDVKGWRANTYALVSTAVVMKSYWPILGSAFGMSASGILFFESHRQSNVRLASKWRLAHKFNLGPS